MDVAGSRCLFGSSQEGERVVYKRTAMTHAAARHRKARAPLIALMSRPHMLTPQYAFPDVSRSFPVTEL